MKAKVKETGEIVNIADYSTIYLEKYDGSYHINELEFIQGEENQSIIDWEQRRYEIAKSAMNAMLANPELLEVVTNKEYVVRPSCQERVAKVSVAYADALITELKKTNERK